jgi:nitroreductase
MNPFDYDIKIFNENCGNLRSNQYQKMTKIQLISCLTIDYHRIEKGLVMENTKPNFGVESGVLNRLYLMNQEFIRRFGDEEKILRIVYHSIKNYLEWHIEQEIEVKCPNILKYLKYYKRFGEDYNKEKIGGIKKIFKKELLEGLNNFEDFFMSRRSVRKYSKDEILDEKIKKCIKLSIYGTPTVCNRPINKVYVIKNFELRKKLLSYQNGNKGFGISAPILLVITTQLQNFQDSTERRTPYIGGGMFSQSLVYSLHSEGLASCCLNWDVEPKKDFEVRKILGLLHETIIMFISVGHYVDEYEVAISDKPDLKDVMKII